MSFLEHLEELRKRIIYAVYGILAGCAVAFFFAQKLTHYLQKYLTQMGGKLIYTEFTGGFFFYFKVGALMGLIIAMPVVLWQLWMFVAPGLYQREKKIVIPFKSAQGMSQREFTTYRTHRGPVVKSIDGKWVSVRMMEEPMKALIQSFSRTKARRRSRFTAFMASMFRADSSF